MAIPISRSSKSSDVLVRFDKWDPHAGALSFHIDPVGCLQPRVAAKALRRIRVLLAIGWLLPALYAGGPRTAGAFAVEGVADSEVGQAGE